MAASMHMCRFCKSSLVSKSSSRNQLIRQASSGIREWFRGQDEGHGEPAESRPTTLEETCKSVEVKGLRKTEQGYNPPDNVSDTIQALAQEVYGVSKHPESFPLDNARLRFKLLVECEKAFQHMIPNRELQQMTQMSHLVEFYTTPVKALTALQELSKSSLPPNLHIDTEYHRYDPQKDGPTAFPKRNVIVSGLKAKKMGVKGHSTPKAHNYLKWPSEQWTQ
ncbi:PREDICTED: 39S ribosomal protein L50, mitochondrial-like [Priapulus caudatus]|uniref:Large ribosomal subunit protein mL50 n=1 Tax=Priapulus caudatus TaxID=37621 RepID=A0ABM1F290_PRICU|nr:PREDICTED: 39S ribosomal protein L50, mitochondrial-like [Priapulus caudatus]